MPFPLHGAVDGVAPGLVGAGGGVGSSLTESGTAEVGGWRGEGQVENKRTEMQHEVWVGRVKEH